AHESGPMFTRLADKAQTGIDFVSPVDLAHKRSFLYHSGTATGGVAIGDVDGDGKPDVFFASGPRGNKLYRQTGALKFEDITTQAGGGLDGGEAWGGGVAMADVNGDGRLDIYVCNYDAPNQLFINLGPGKNGEPVTFAERAKEYGLDIVDASHSAYFADYDNDGHLDMYLLTNRYDDPAGFNPIMPAELKDGVPVLKAGAEKYQAIWRLDENNWGTEPAGTPDRLMHNDGKGHFTDVSKQAGISGRGDGLSATWFDYNNDGKLDLWVANDFLSEDRLYRNNGDGTFTNVLADAVPHTCWFSMGADFADFNNDGWFDFFLADMSATNHFKAKTTGGMSPIEFRRAAAASPAQVSHNCLFINTGTGRFLEVAQALGVAGTDWSWAVKCADFDNDGWTDIYVNNGVVRMMNDADVKIPQDMLVGKRVWDFYKDGAIRKEEHHAFRNAGALRFVPSGTEWGLDHVGVSYGCAYADLDRDGDLDLVEVNLEENVAVYRNDSATGHRALFALAGTKSNRQGIGARVTVRTKSGQQVRLLSPCTGYQSCNEAVLHFGLGEDAVMEEVTVRWPGGTVQRFEKLEADRFYTITEGESGTGIQPVTDTGRMPVPLFLRSDLLSGSKHEIPASDDFAKQSLLPHGLSNLGPGMAWGDVDGDGDFDYYMAKGAGQIGEVRFNNGSGRFIARFSPAFRADKTSEDFAPVFFDADGDGDLDLFVGGGSYQFAPGDPEQRDRLYLNDGKGNFTRAEGALPMDEMPAGAVCVADFDGDGDLDLFVGDRVIAEDFPMPADGRILRNNGKGKFAEATKEVAPELIGTGLVTSALWTDADDDGALDLLVAHEWGPVQLFLNRKGKLVPRKASDDLTNRRGWWNGLAAADVNHDGKMDYVAMNLGWNTRYGRPGARFPGVLFYGQFFDGGLPKIVEAHYEGERLLPVRGLNVAAAEMPELKQLFRTHKAYAAAELEQIYSAKSLAAAKKFEADTLESGVFINNGPDANGEPTFTFQPLDLRAQFAPGFGVICSDVDGDGNADIFIAQNQSATHPELPRFDGGLSELLLGDGLGGFAPVEPLGSGIAEPGDGRACVLADLDGDDWPDLAVCVNGKPMSAFTNSGKHDVRAMLRVELPAGAAGARVSVACAGLKPQTAELAIGGGYGSQGPPLLWFGLGTEARAGNLLVRWPNGKTSMQEFSGTRVKLAAP
ncbi:MAG: CRTAC1 family protein, partial [Chthoniobacteraceae bacterium]